MKKNVVINYKSDGRLNFGRINLSKNFNNILKISSDNNQVFLEFLNKFFLYIFYFQSSIY